MMVRLGINYHPTTRGGQPYNAAEKAYIPQFIRKLNASANLVMDDWTTAQQFKDIAPQNIVVFRKYHEREGDFWNVLTPEQWHTGMKIYTDPRIVLHCLNEPSTYILKSEMEKKIKWLVPTIELFGQQNQPLVVDNVGTGHYDYSWFDEDEKWAVIEPLFAALKKYPFMFWGCHEYFSYRGLEIGNGRVGRHAEIAKRLKARGYDMPPTLLTEIGCDQIDDAPKRGWRDSMTENQYAAYLTDAQRSTWHVPYIRGAMIYCFGASTNEWNSFNVADTLVLHASLISANAVQDEPKPEPPPVPLPIPPVEHMPPPPPTSPTLIQAEIDLRRIVELNAQIDAAHAEIASILAKYQPLRKIA